MPNFTLIVNKKYIFITVTYIKLKIFIKFYISYIDLFYLSRYNHIQ